jgi:hypothetical protein
MADEELDLDQVDDEQIDDELTQDEMELAEILDLPDDERKEREAELVADEGGEKPEADSGFFGPVVDEEGNEVQG